MLSESIQRLPAAALVHAMILAFLGAAAGEVPLGVVWEWVDGREGAAAKALCTDGGRIFAAGEGGAIWSRSDGEWVLEGTGVREDLEAMAGGEGVWVTVGAGGRILRSTGGGEWTAEPSGTEATLRAVTHGGGMFVGVGDNGTALRSYDGRAWTSWQTGIAERLNDVIWDGTSFFAVGNKATILTAPPGGTWSLREHALAKNVDYQRIVRGPDRYVVDGRAWSTDGVTWNNLYSGVKNDLTFSGSLYVAGREAGEIQVSADGLHWEIIRTGSTEDIVAVAWTGSGFAALTPTRSLLSSDDGFRWTSSGLFSHSLRYEGGCWDGTQFVVAGHSGTVLTSPNGREWTTEVTPTEATLRTASSGGGATIAAGDDGTIIRSMDGRAWELVPLPASWSFYDSHWTGEEFLLVGTGGIILSSHDGLAWEINNPGHLDCVAWDGTRYLAFSGCHVLESEDGNRWQTLTKVAWPTTGSTGDAAMNDLIWTGSAYVAVGSRGWILTSPDGLEWTRGTLSGVSFVGRLTSVAWSGSRYVAVGGQYSGSSTDGLNWTMVENSMMSLRDVAWNGSKFFAAGNTAVRSSTDGLSWTLVHERQVQLESIAWSGSEWIVGGKLGDRALMARSADGTTWTDFLGDPGRTILDVTSGGGIHGALDDAGNVVRFASGVWSQESSGLLGEPFRVISTAEGFAAFARLGMVSLWESGGSWTPGDRRLNRDLVRCITSGAGILVAGTQGNGSTTTFLTSQNGSDWTRHEYFGPPGGPFVDAIWDGERFHLLGASQTFVSEDGTNWTTQFESQWGVYEAHCLAWIEGRVVAAGAGGIWSGDRDGFEKVHVGSETFTALIPGSGTLLALSNRETLASENGINWEPVVTKPRRDGNIRDVITTPAGFVAAGDAGLVWTSPDGETWQRHAVSVVPKLNALAFGDGVIVGVGTGAARSGDGLEWEQALPTQLKQSPLEDVAWGGGRFVAVGASLTAWSEDGRDWHLAKSPIPLNTITWTGTEFLARDREGAVLLSADGDSWRFVVIPRLSAAATGNGMTVAINYGGRLFLSTDGGQEWTLLSTITRAGTSSSNPQIAFVGGRFFTFSSSAAFTSADGFTWSPVYTYPPPSDVVWTGQAFVGIGSGGRISRSDDGVTWTSSSIAEFSGGLLDAVWTGSQVIAVGTNGAAFSSPDGIAWTPLTSGTTEHLLEVVWDGEQAVARTNTYGLVYFSSGPPLPAGFSARALDASHGRLVVAGSAGKIAILGDTGWEVTDTGAAASLYHLSPTPTGWLASGSGSLLVRGTTDPVPTWEIISRSVLTIGETVEGTAHTSGTTVSVGSRGGVSTSTGGRIWNLWRRPVAGALHAGTVLGNGDFAGVGADGAIVRLTPGGTAYIPRSPTGLDLHAIASSDDRLVAAGDSGVILLSKTGAEARAGYESWMAEEVGTVGTVDADNNSDGIPNLIAYLHGIPAGSSPSLADRQSLPAMETTAGAALTFEIDARDDVEVRILRSFDCTVWTEVARKIGTGSWGGTAAVSEEAIGGGRMKCHVSEPAIAADQERVFYRLECSLR